MAWLMVLTAIMVAMLAIEGIWAERNFSRSLQPLEPRGWDPALVDELLLRSKG